MNDKKVHWPKTRIIKMTPPICAMQKYFQSPILLSSCALMRAFKWITTYEQSSQGASQLLKVKNKFLFIDWIWKPGNLMPLEVFDHIAILILIAIRC